MKGKYSIAYICCSIEKSQKDYLTVQQLKTQQYCKTLVAHIERNARELINLLHSYLFIPIQNRIQVNKLNPQHTAIKNFNP